jgi:hypothetical protein
MLLEAHPRSARCRSPVNLVMAERKVLVAVVLVSPTFYPDAVMVELQRHEDGWCVWFVRPHMRESQFFKRSDIGEDIDERALINEGNVVRYMESCLRAAGYRGISRRSTVVGGDVAAIWDLEPTARHSAPPRSSAAPRSTLPCPQCGHDLTSSLMHPRGTDADGVIHQAKYCSYQDLLFGEASDGLWTIPLRP